MSKAFWFPGGRWLNRLRDILRLYVGGMGFHDALGVYTITRPIHLFLPYTIICGKKKKKVRNVKEIVVWSRRGGGPHLSFLSNGIVSS